MQHALPPFGRPSCFPTGPRLPFPRQQVFPFAALHVPEPHPDKVKELVSKNTAVFGLVPAQFPVENDQTLAQIRGGMRLMARSIAQSAGVTDLDRMSSELWSRQIR